MIGLAAAAFLADDVHMPAGNITIYEALEESASSIPVGPEDLVLFTNDSMTQNTAWGDTNTVTVTNRDTTPPDMA